MRTLRWVTTILPLSTVCKRCVSPQRKRCSTVVWVPTTRPRASVIADHCDHGRSVISFQHVDRKNVIFENVIEHITRILPLPIFFQFEEVVPVHCIIRQKHLILMIRSPSFAKRTHVLNRYTRVVSGIHRQPRSVECVPRAHVGFFEVAFVVSQIRSLLAQRFE